MRARFVAPLLIFGFAAGPAHAQISAAGVTLRSFDGRSTQAESGHLSVPAERSHLNRRFEVAFNRLASRQPEKGVPIVFLMGGPGVSARFIAQVPPYFNLFTRLQIPATRAGTSFSRAVCRSYPV